MQSTHVLSILSGMASTKQISLSLFETPLFEAHPPCQFTSSNTFSYLIRQECVSVSEDQVQIIQKPSDQMSLCGARQAPQTKRTPCIATGEHLISTSSLLSWGPCARVRIYQHLHIHTLSHHCLMPFHQQHCQEHSRFVVLMLSRIISQMELLLFELFHVDVCEWGCVTADLCLICMKVECHLMCVFRWKDLHRSTLFLALIVLCTTRRSVRSLVSREPKDLA